MTVTEKYGFKFVQTAWDAPAVQAFFYAHLHKYGYPLTTLPAATKWCGVTHNNGVYCIFGWHPMPNGVVNISDFYTSGGRWGALACYAGLERIKSDATRTGTTVITPTPAQNTPMIRAYRRVFEMPKDGLPALHVYMWKPLPVEPLPVEVDAPEICELVESA